MKNASTVLLEWVNTDRAQIRALSNKSEGINMKEDLYGDGIGKVELVEYMGSDLTIVNSARVSFGVEKDSLDERDEKLIKYLINNKHTSTLEHNVMTFKFTEQHKINRQASSEESALRQDSNKFVFEGAARTALVAYNELLCNGVSREQARMILPVNLYTEYYGTVNLNNLFKFIKLRNHPHAQHEIQVVARACLNIAAGLFPVALDSWNKNE